ncbi:MAG: XRE family transcriptional regulator [Thiothrix sp.]|jgi:predicted transcriptional regulator|uniref:XRE family transcriptional regulator n=1 Tax=Thiothrix sp. TaxID=1032 RepID=UPI0026284E3D|nr:XRE family transcriptional regulator [Thiothrix sp.]MDD5394101.1 XRE family transcriptional regulator [Thiothrix sp.]
MAKPLSELLKQVSPEVKAAASAKAVEMLAELTLAELRQQRGKTQVEVAQSMGIQQPNVAQLERRDDIYLSTLRKYVEVLGGRLELTVCFPDGASANIHLQHL